MPAHHTQMEQNSLLMTLNQGLAKPATMQLTVVPTIQVEYARNAKKVTPARPPQVEPNVLLAILAHVEVQQVPLALVNLGSTVITTGQHRVLKANTTTKAQNLVKTAQKTRFVCSEEIQRRMRTWTILVLTRATTRRLESMSSSSAQQATIAQMLTMLNRATELTAQVSIIVKKED